MLLHLPSDQESWLPHELHLSDRRTLELYRVHPEEFQQEINVLVVESVSPDGLPRVEIRSSRGPLAAAGVNWKGAVFSEVYVEGAPEARSRGLTRSVLASLSGVLLKGHSVPLIFLDELDAAGQAEAFWVGFRRTGDRFVRGTAAWAQGGREPRK
jgi:hypothetical protein